MLKTHKNDTAATKAVHGRIIWVDSMRGFACQIVLFAHILRSDPVYGDYATGCGKLGVWLFMIMSGFLFAQSSLHSGKQFSLRSVLVYYVKKARRIYPEYIIALLFTAMLGYFSIPEIFDMLLLKTTWGHFWYIPTQIKFYLIAPVFAFIKWKIAGEGNNPRIYRLILLAMIIGITILFPNTRFEGGENGLCWYLPLFIMGIILSEVASIYRMESIWFDIASCVAVICIFAMTPLGRKLLLGETPGRFLVNKYLFVGALWVLVLLGNMYGKILPVLSKRWLFFRKVGAVSYEMYLFHYGILVWLGTNYGLPTWARGLLTIVLTLLIAIPVYYANKYISGLHLKPVADRSGKAK